MKYSLALYYIFVVESFDNSIFSLSMIDYLAKLIISVLMNQSKCQRQAHQFAHNSTLGTHDQRDAISFLHFHGR